MELTSAGWGRNKGEQEVLQFQDQHLNGISLTILCADQKATFSAKELGLFTDAPSLLAQAYSRNRSGALAVDFDSTNRPFVKSTVLYVDDAHLKQTLEAFLNKYDIPAQDATASFDTRTRSFVYTAEHPGRTVDADAVAAAIKSRLLSGDYSPYTVEGKDIRTLTPKVTTQDVMYNTSLIGSCMTLATKNPSRNANIQLMCHYVDGVCIMPGEALSLNELVGERTAQKGFQPAPSIIDGQLADSLGGGICQLAGTLYNAALVANMEIVERVHHTWPSEYLPIGLDATLNWDDKDLKIRNSSEYPVYISATFENLTLNVQIYGQPLPEGMEIVIETVTQNETEAPEPVKIYTDELPNGTKRVKAPSRKGYDVSVYRDFLKDGNSVKNELLYTDHFRPIRGTILIGTNNVIK